MLPVPEMVLGESMFKTPPTPIGDVAPRDKVVATSVPVTTNAYPCNNGLTLDCSSIVPVADSWLGNGALIGSFFSICAWEEERITRLKVSIPPWPMFGSAVLSVNVPRPSGPTK